MKPVLLWIATITVYLLPGAIFVGVLWLMMSMHPGIGIGQAALMVLRGVGAMAVPMTAGRLARRAFKRPKEIRHVDVA